MSSETLTERIKEDVRQLIAEKNALVSENYSLLHKVEELEKELQRLRGAKSESEPGRAGR